MSLNAQLPNFNWAGAFVEPVPTTAISRINSITIDASGNVYSTGYFGGTIDFDPGPGTFSILPSGISAFITKLNANGNFVWAKSFTGGTSGGIGNAINTDANGNVFIIGSFKSTVDFDPGPNTFNLTSAGDNDVFICKLNSLGNFVWAKRIGGSSSFPGDNGWSISIDGNGNVFSTGSFYGTVDFNPGPGAFNLVSNGSSDVFISKLDSSGNFVWARSFGSIAGDEGFSIDNDALGNVYVTGNFRLGADFDAGIGTYSLNSVGNTDVFITKYDPSGNFVWVKSFGGIIEDAGTSLTVDKTGNSIVTGYFKYTTDFDPGPGTFTLNPVTLGTKDAFILKLDALGNFLWVKSLGGTGDEEGSAIATDNERNIYSTGSYDSGADFDPSPLTYTMNTIGFSDIYVNKIDSMGNFIWTYAIGGNNNERSKSLAISSCADLHVAGYFGGSFGGSVDFDPSMSTFSISTSASNETGFIQKLNPIYNVPLNPLNVTPSTNLIICENKSTTLTANGNGTITWYPSMSSTAAIATGSLFITPSLSSGSYTYYAGVTSCTVSALRTPITITVNPLPIITASTSNNFICNGQTATLTANGALTYTFNPGGISASIIVSPTLTTTYTVTGTSVDGCSNFAVITQSVGACVGLDEINLNNFNIQVYPNPNNGLLIVESDEVLTITFFDVTGKTILNQQLQNGRNQININNFYNGIYFLKINNHHFEKNYRIIKN